MSDSCFSWQGDALTLRIRVTPRSGINRIEGQHEGLLRVRVAAAPADNAANKAVLKLLAAEFGVPKSRVTLVRGDTARQKQILISAPTRFPECGLNWSQRE